MDGQAEFTWVDGDISRWFVPSEDGHVLQY